MPTRTTSNVHAFADLEAASLWPRSAPHRRRRRIELADLADPVPLAGGQVTGTAVGLFAGRRTSPPRPRPHRRAGRRRPGRRLVRRARAPRRRPRGLRRRPDRRPPPVRHRVVEQAPGGPRHGVLPDRSTGCLIKRHRLVPTVPLRRGGAAVRPRADVRKQRRPATATGPRPVRPSGDLVVVAAGAAAGAFDLADLDRPGGWHPGDPAVETRPRRRAPGRYSGDSERQCNGCPASTFIEIAPKKGTTNHMAYSGVVRQYDSDAHVIPGPRASTSPRQTTTRTRSPTNTVLYRTMESSGRARAAPSTCDDQRYEDKKLAVDRLRHHGVHAQQHHGHRDHRRRRGRSDDV